MRSSPSKVARAGPASSPGKSFNVLRGGGKVDVMLGAAAIGVLAGWLLRGSYYGVGPTTSFSGTRATKGQTDVYTEMLVHPGLVATVFPHRVLIFGEPSAGTLCQVLKHKMVEEVTLAPFGSASAAGLTSPECGFQYGNRVTVVATTADMVLSESGGCKEYRTDVNYGTAFDAVIVDAPASSGMSASTSALFAEDAIAKLKCVITPNATVIAQLGRTPDVVGAAASSYRALHDRQQDVIEAMHRLCNDGGVHVYDTFTPAADGMLSYAVACVGKHCSTRFQTQNSAMQDLQLHRRVQSHALPTLQWYDGGTQLQLHAPSRAWENLYCDIKPTAWSCQRKWVAVGDAQPAARGKDDFMDHRPEDAWFELKDSGRLRAAGENRSDLGIYARQDIKSGTPFLFDAATAVVFSESQLWGIEEVVSRTGNQHLANLLTWIERYGYGCKSPTGEYKMSVAGSSVLTFVNHACPPDPGAMGMESSEDPAIDDESWLDNMYRIRTKERDCGESKVGRDVRAGEQITEDYALNFAEATEEDEKDSAAEYNSWCTGVKPASAAESVAKWAKDRKEGVNDQE